MCCVYDCLQCIEKTDRGYMLAIDAGESMQYGGVLGCETMTPLIASAAVAMMFMRSEPNCQIVGMAASALEPLDIRSSSSLTEICTAVSRVCFFLCGLCLLGSRSFFFYIVRSICVLQH